MSQKKVVNSKKQFLFYLICVLGMAVLPLLIGITTYADDNSSMYATTSSPFGVPYKEWVHRWWQWNIGIPTTEHPNTNYVAEKCSTAQDKDSPVWFLTLPFGEEQKTDRICNIPSGKAVFSALLSGECDYSDPRVTNDDFLKTCASEGNDYGAIQVSLDGIDMKYDLPTNRITTDYYNVTLPEGNFFSSPVGTFRAVSDGYFLFLQPLKVGEHELKYKVSVLNPTKTEYNYFQEVTYHLIVK